MQLRRPRKSRRFHPSGSACQQDQESQRPIDSANYVTLAGVARHLA
jgi:hypothetical protein